MYDATTITVLASNYNELVEILVRDDPSFFSLGDGKLFYRWPDWNTDSYDEACQIEVINMSVAGIVQKEMH